MDAVVSIMLLSTKNMYAVCQQRQKKGKQKSWAQKPHVPSADSGLLKHKRICSDPSITELKKSRLMESQHVVKALTTDTDIR